MQSEDHATPCLTPGEAAYRAHLRRREPACAACLAEAARVKREKRQARQCSELGTFGKPCENRTTDPAGKCYRHG